MPRHLLRCALALLLAAGCTSQTIHGDGVLKTDSRALPGAFSALASRTFANVEVTIGSPASLTVTCDENLLPYLSTTLEGATLVVAESTPVGRSLVPTKSCDVRVTTPLLLSLTSSGAGSLSVDNAVKAPTFDVSLSGAGAVHVATLDVGAMTARLSGAGELVVAGHAKSETINLSGVGRVSATKLAVEDAMVHLSGAGEVDLTASKSFGGSLSGVGHVKVAGNPAVRNAKVSGLGGVSYE